MKSSSRPRSRVDTPHRGRLPASAALRADELHHSERSVPRCWLCVRLGARAYAHLGELGHVSSLHPRHVLAEQRLHALQHRRRLVLRLGGALGHRVARVLAQEGKVDEQREELVELQLGQLRVGYQQVLRTRREVRCMPPDRTRQPSPTPRVPDSAKTPRGVHRRREHEMVAMWAKRSEPSTV
eukprot:1828172-Prymnesium_polylepis.2